jgi:hexosaminidase
MTASLRIPRPQSRLEAGSFALTRQRSGDKADSAVAHRFARSLAVATGLDLPVQIGSGSGKRSFRRAAVATRARPRATSDEFGRGNDHLSALAGAFYATQNDSRTVTAGDPPLGDCRHGVDDSRRHDRGLSTLPVARRTFDVGRHFMPKEFVKKYIDSLALHKMNRFHWHLTEDQAGASRSRNTRD